MLVIVAAKAVWKIKVNPMASGWLSIRKIVFIVIMVRTMSVISENSLLKIVALEVIDTFWFFWRLKAEANFGLQDRCFILNYLVLLINVKFLYYYSFFGIFCFNWSVGFLLSA
jgi:hypothetical protein